jgi:hypothetical protein
MSVLPNQTNATPGDAFFWRVDAEIITAKQFIAYSTIQTLAFSTGSITVGNVSTTGNLTVSGDVTALNVTATDSLTTYFANTQYVTSDQGANIKGLLLANQIQGSNLVQFPNAILSSITTTSVSLDGNTLDTAGVGVGAVLLLNGQPIATASTLTSSIQTWSYWPAISTLQMSGQNLLGAANVQGDNAFFYDINAANQIVFGTNLFGPTANLSNINTNLISSAALLASSIKTVNLSTVNLQATTIKNVGTLTSQQADITTVNATSITTDSLTTLTGGTVSGTNGSFQNLTVTNSANFSGTRPNFTTGINSSGANNFNNQSLDNCPNINTQGTTNMLIAAANAMDLKAPTRIQLICDGGSDFGSVKPVNIIGKNGNRGQVNITAEPGYINVGSQIQGEVNITANGGGGLTAYATGGNINITATTGSSPILGTLTYSAIKINAASVLSYAGFATPLAGVPGYNYIQGTLGINLVAGSVSVIPNVPGTIYLYGATGIPQQTGGIRAQNGLGIDFIVPYPTGFIGPEKDLFISGNPAGNKVTLSNVRTLQSDGGVAYGFTSMTTNNFQASNIVMFGNGTNNGNILGLSGLEQLTNFSNVSSLNVQGGLGNFITVVPQQVSTQSIFLSSINGLPFSAIVAPTIPSTFVDLTTNLLQANTISTNSLGAFTLSNVSSINGFSLAQLVSSVSPPIPAPSTFLDLYTSSFVANTIQTSNISSVSMQANSLTGVSTINGFTIAQFVSSVSPQAPAPSTFTQLFTSSLVADSITGASFSPGLKLLGNGVTIQPTLDNSITLTTTGVGLVTIVSQEEMQVFTPSTIVFGDFRATTINGLPPVTSIPTNYPQLTVSSLVGSNISTTVLNAAQVLLNGVALGPQVSSFDTLAANQISSGSLQVSSIGGYNLNQIINQPIVSSFNDLTVSTINAYNGGILYQTGITLDVSSINGYNVNQFLSTPSPTIQVSTFNQLFTSSLLASGIVTSDLSTTTLKTSSINGYNIAQLANQPTVSTFQQLFTSSLQANQISTGVITASNISTQNINAYTLGGISSVNGFSIAQLVSSVSPQPPIPSTVTQFYTSSLAANGITNYQTGDLNITTAAYMDLLAGVAVRIGADQCNVSITAPSLVENVGQFTTNNTGLDYAVTAGRNISMNSSNTLSIYNTNTAPPVASNDLYIIGQGNTTLAGQNNLNLSGILDVNITGTFLYAQTSGVQFQVPTGAFAVNATNMPLVGTTAVNLNTNSNINLFSLSSITTSAVSTINTVPATWFSGDIRANTFNGLPLPTGGGGGSVTSTFNQLNTRILSNNPVYGNDLLIRAANAIVLNDTGETTVSLGGSLEVTGPATGAVNIQTVGFNSLNNFIALSAYNTLDLLSVSSLTVTGQSSLNLYSPALLWNDIPIGSVVSSFSTVYTHTIKNNPQVGFGLSNDLVVTADANVRLETANGNVSINVLSGYDFIVQTPVSQFTSPGGAFDVITSQVYLNVDSNINLNSLSTITTTAVSTINTVPATWFSGDITAATFNGAPLPTGGGGINTAELTSTVTGLGTAGYLSTATVTSTFNTLFTSTISGNPLNYLSLVANRSITLNSVSTIVRSRGAWFSEDITASTFNGAPLPTGGGSWVGTATSDLNMNGYTLSNVPNIYGNGTMTMSNAGLITIATNSGSDVNINTSTIKFQDTDITKGGWLSLDADAQLNYAAQWPGYEVGSNGPIPLIQCGKINLTISEDNTLIGGDYTIPIAYDDNAYCLQLTYSSYPPYAPDAGIVWSGQAYTSNTFQIAAQGSNVGSGITLDWFWTTTGKYPKGTAIPGPPPSRPLFL